MSPVTTKTIGPLHLEDLEPHRFEDLVRQLLYDFRTWRDLEATGRSGSDEGFDARGWEIVGGAPPVWIGDGDTPAGDDADNDANDRQWLIQCKREKSISPAKLRSYLEDLPNVEQENLYGIVFVAACDFSKKARDTFYDVTRQLGFLEVKLWGKAELEDQLFQPKNDHLLFAYFGFSLQVRQRSMKTTIRARLMTKRKAQKALTAFTEILIRDASDERYPHLDPDDNLPEVKRRRWKVFRCAGCFYDGVYFTARRSFAFLDDDGVHWDIAERINDAIPHNDPWRIEPQNRSDEDWKIRTDTMQKWDALEEKNKGWLETFFVLPYDRILAIDEDGDEFFSHPHVYVAPFGERGPFADYCPIKLENNEHWNKVQISPLESTRIAFFDRAPPEDDISKNFYADAK
ncbi:restriction endonuclease [Methylobacterium komagatae]|uniref:Restriction endonuclease n=1 Tax=Methylobacterium komagatae TaxID=374425 RepID=A0ABW2BR49_9HYPH